MTSQNVDDECEIRRWVRYHVIAFFALIGVAAGIIIVDAKVALIIGEKEIAGFRTILLISVLLTGLGARALLAWRSATVDLQGRIFLVVVGLALLTGAAFGLANSYQEVKEHYSKDPRPGRFDWLDWTATSPNSSDSMTTTVRRAKPAG